MATEKKLIETVNTFFVEAMEDRDHRDWLERARTGFRFRVGGDGQWETEDIEKLKSEERPHLTLNKVLPVTNILGGTQRQNRQDFKVLAHKGGQVRVANVLTELMHHTVEVSDAQYIFSDAFDDGVACGKGVIGLDITYEHDPINGDIVIEKYSPFDFLEDQEAIQYDMNLKGRFVMLHDWFEQDELIAMYPKKARELKSVGTRLQPDNPDMQKIGRDVDPSNYRTERNKLGLNVTQPGEIERFRRRKCWWKSKERRRILVNKRTLAVRLLNKTTDDVAKEMASRDSQTFKIVERLVPVLHLTTIVGDVVVQNIDDPFNGVSLFPVMRFCPYWIDGYVMGIIDNAVDPQREHNKRRSQALHHLNQSANSGWKGDEDATDDWDAVEHFGSKPGQVIKVNRGKNLERIEPVKISSGHLTLDQLAAQDIKDITGINDQLQGSNPGREESGRAIKLRQIQGLVGAEPVFDNFNRTLKIVGTGLLELIRSTDVYSPAEIEAIIGDSDSAEGPFDPAMLKQFGLGRYGVEVTLSPESPTVRLDNYLTLIEAARAGLPIPPQFIIQASDLPNKNEIMQVIQQQQQIQEQKDLAEAAAKSGAANSRQSSAPTVQGQ